MHSPITSNFVFSSPMAHSSSPVKVVEVCKVAPQPSSSASELDHSPTPPAPESLPLTFFDLLWLRFAPVQRLFFYETSDSFETAFFDKLKTSLSITLQHFLPLAGNLTWPQDSHKPILTYVKGDAVSLTIARSDADNFYHLSSRNEIVEAEEYHPLTPELAVSRERAAAMAFQVTIFPNKGFCIGISMHHAILDGKTSTMFVKSWARTCKHESKLLPDQLKPFYDRSVIQDSAGLEPLYLNQFLNMDGPNNRSLMVTQYKSPPPDPVRCTFVFTRAKIEALKQLVKQKEHQQQQQQHDQYQSVHLSTFSVTFAYTWVCFLKAGKIQPETAIMGFTVDCRSRLDPPLPGNYLGNCMAGTYGGVETKALVGEDGLVLAVNAISEVIKRLDTAGVLNGAETWIPLAYRVESSGEKVFGVAGSPRFRIYDTDFGWGRPSKVEIVSIEGTGAMSLSESRDSDGGVEVGLVLNKHHMQAFASLFAQGIQDL